MVKEGDQDLDLGTGNVFGRLCLNVAHISQDNAGKTTLLYRLKVRSRCLLMESFEIMLTGL